MDYEIDLLEMLRVLARRAWQIAALRAVHGSLFPELEDAGSVKLLRRLWCKRLRSCPSVSPGCSRIFICEYTELR